MTARIVLANAGVRWKIAGVMISRFVLAVAVIALVGAGVVFGAQGNNAFAPVGSSRAGGMITPGSLYKNQIGNQGTVRTFNNATQPGSRAPSTVPQNSTFSQPLYKPAPLTTPLQPSAFTTTPQTKAPGASSYTPSYTPLQTTPLATLPYTTGRPTTPQSPSPYPGMAPNSSFTPPAQQPIYSIAPQFNTIPPSPYAAQPGPYSMPPAAKPIYTMGQQTTAKAPLVSGMPQSGPFSTTYQPFSLTSPQNTPQSQFQYAPLSSPLTVPTSTPLAVPLQQPSVVPSAPSLLLRPPTQPLPLR